MKTIEKQCKEKGLSRTYLLEQTEGLTMEFKKSLPSEEYINEKIRNIKSFLDLINFGRG